MSDKKPEQEPSTSEGASLEERQESHRFLTTEEAQAWNARQPLKPLPDSHWMVKAEKQRQEEERLARMRFLASGWKRLAKKMRTKVVNLIDLYMDQRG